MMDEDEDEDELVYLDGARWSWPSFFAEFFIAVTTFAEAIAIQFQRMHNLAHDKRTRIDDGESFASDVLSGLKNL